MSRDPSYLAVVPACNGSAAISRVIEGLHPCARQFDLLVVDAEEQAADFERGESYERTRFARISSN